MKSTAILTAIIIATIFGDYLIKISSEKPNGLMTLPFAGGMLLYALPAIGWFYLMRTHSLATIGVFYSAGMILILTGLGVFVFKEAFGWRDLLGVSLAISAVFIIGH